MTIPIGVFSAHDLRKRGIHPIQATRSSEHFMRGEGGWREPPPIRGRIHNA